MTKPSCVECKNETSSPYLKYSLMGLVAYLLLVPQIGLLRPPLSSSLNPYQYTDRCIYGFATLPLGRTFYTIHTNSSRIPTCTATTATWHIPPMAAAEDNPCEATQTLYSFVLSGLLKLSGKDKYYPAELVTDGNCVLSQPPLPVFMTNTSLPLPLLQNDQTQRAVLIPGIASTSDVWADTAAALAYIGYDVLTYDLWGRGFTDAPDTDISEDVLVAQLAELLFYVGWSDRPITVVGYSMGGGVAARFASTFPEKVRNLVLLAPAGLKQGDILSTTNKLGKLLIKIPAIGPGVLKIVTPLRILMSEDDPVRNYREASMCAWHPGYVRSWTSNFGNYDLFGTSTLPNTYDHIRRIHERYPRLLGSVLSVWGTEDEILPYSLSKQLVQRVPQTKLVTVQGAKHALLTGPHSQQVLDIVISHLANV